MIFFGVRIVPFTIKGQGRSGSELHTFFTLPQCLTNLFHASFLNAIGSALWVDGVSIPFDISKDLSICTLSIAFQNFEEWPT